ncbi:aspartate--tRNA(Asn) ligase [Candidatus Nanohalobium constans]|uniref:Aspartate--tRNA(Asp/Asn) ligase n=1 Tax=Candidatus Nanohalobium constans TaxID=2565781 RepID=A0A5Q0UEV4_9ARCH|nr:aspartate--tRNA(Asn) ligase [Candidatus Nanohalobium constans]QGA80076.1 aspartyl-tRNA synthetase [Candidatus Nanohalobium constans]
MIERIYTHDITPEDDGEEVAVAGWAHEIRDLGGITFIVVRDREGQIQATFKEDRNEELFNKAQEVGKEDLVHIKGEVTETDQAPGNRELVPKSLEIVGEAESPLPMDISKDIDSDLSTRLDNRFIDLRTPEVHAIFSLRSHLVQSMEEWFDEEGYIDIETPTIAKMGAEGGAELFPVIYYDQEAFLSQSPQLYKQMLMAAGFDKVYKTGTAFRAEEFATSRHVSEISMFDVELAFIEDQHDVMDVVEESLRYTLKETKERADDDLEVLDIDLEIPEDDFPRIKFEEARRILREEYDHSPEDEGDLDTEGEQLLGEHFIEQGHPAVFIVGYPGEKFYYGEAREEDEYQSRRFDMLYKGLELVSGGQREHDPDRLMRKVEEEGIDPEDISFYLESFKFGMPPHGGYGLGLDRLVKQVAELDNIKEAILFPRTPDRLEP